MKLEYVALIYDVGEAGEEGEKKEGEEGGKGVQAQMLAPSVNFFFVCFQNKIAHELFLKKLWTGRLQNFTGLNYAFQLTPTLVLDALSAGNEIRYINDSRSFPDDDANESIQQPPTVVISPNCEASIWLVNDVHHIAITAS
jgi:hypothetical protein